MTSKLTSDQEHNAVVTDYELESGAHPIGKLVHLSSVTHAWRGVLEAVTPSEYVLSREHPVSLVDETGSIGAYMSKPTAAHEGDTFDPAKLPRKKRPQVRVPRAAVAWSIVWDE